MSSVFGEPISVKVMLQSFRKRLEVDLKIATDEAKRAEENFIAAQQNVSRLVDGLAHVDNFMLKNLD